MFSFFFRRQFSRPKSRREKSSTYTQTLFPVCPLSTYMFKFKRSRTRSQRRVREITILRPQGHDGKSNERRFTSSVVSKIFSGVHVLRLLSSHLLLYGAPVFQIHHSFE